MGIDKYATFRQKMDKLGLVQANEWVPRDRRELFKAVAKALRDGLPVAIGEAAFKEAKEALDALTGRV